MNRKILVLGATGKVGKAVVKLLAERQVPVIAFTRNAEKARLLFRDDLQIAEGDMNNRESLEKAMSGVKKVLLSSPPALNLLQLQTNAIEAAKAAGVQQLVKISALGASPDSKNIIGKMHGQAEDILEASGVQWTHVRPHFFMDNFLEYAPDVKKGALYFGAADGKIPPVDVRDIAAVAVAALTHEGHHEKKYPVSGPRAYNFYEIADVFSQIIGHEVTYHPISFDEVRRREMELYGKPEWIAKGMAGLQTYWAAGKSAETYSTVKEMTGRDGIDFEQFVMDHKEVLVA